MNDVDPSTVPWGVRAEVAWEQQPTVSPLLPSRPGGHILFTYSYHSAEANFASASFLPQLHRISPNASGFTDYLANASLFQFSVGGNPITGALDARFSSDGARIAYVANRLYSDGQFIVIMNPDGSGKQLGSPLLYISHLDWSPDGRQIVFTGSEIANFAPERHKLWLMNADGTNIRRLADLGRGTDPNFSLADIQLSFPSWSPDGVWIAFAASGGIPRSRWIVRDDGTAPPVSVVAAAGFDDRVAWSPNGTKVAFTKTSRIHVADFTPSPVPRFDNIRRLTGLLFAAGEYSNEVNEKNPLWSPDGMSIAYSSPLDLVEGTGRNLWVMNSDGTLPLPLTSLLGTVTPTSWGRISTRFDATPPVVTPPQNLTIPATDLLGARASTSPALFAFLRGGSATDNEDPSPREAHTADRRSRCP